MSVLEFPRHRKEDAEIYNKFRWWSGITLGDVLDKTADLYPRKEALVDDRVRLTYSELREIVNRLAVGMIDLGIAKGETVLLQLPNWAEFVYAYFALQKIGAIPVILISGYRQLEVSHLCSVTEAKTWIVPDIYRDLNYVSFIEEVKEMNPQLKHLISARAGRKNVHFEANLESLIGHKLSINDKYELADRRPEPNDVAQILPSGGTTALPKAIPRTHNEFICNAEYAAKVLEMNTDDICLVAIPAGHAFALRDIVVTVLVGCRMILLDSTRPSDICSAIQGEKVTHMQTVPSLIRRVLNFEALADYKLDSLKRIVVGGEPCPPSLAKEVYYKFGCKYISSFGMTEGLPCRTRPDDDLEIVCNTVGKQCCPYDQVKIINEEGEELPPNTDGELVAKGPGIFAGYLKNHEENKKAFTVDGFFKTGDMARIDELGNIKITGRIKDIIIRGGENISPAQVEALLLYHPGIADVAVIGIPDEELGEKVCAFIQPNAGMKLDSEEIKVFMQSKGASKLLIPEIFQFIDALPMTKAGKHDKKTLIEYIKRKN